MLPSKTFHLNLLAHSTHQLAQFFTSATFSFMQNMGNCDVNQLHICFVQRSANTHHITFATDVDSKALSITDMAVINLFSIIPAKTLLFLACCNPMRVAIEHANLVNNEVTAAAFSSLELKTYLRQSLDPALSSIIKCATVYTAHLSVGCTVSVIKTLT